MYKCGWQGCEKAYGTLNHLNAHVTMQSHGAKRTPEGTLRRFVSVYARSHFVVSFPWLVRVRKSCMAQLPPHEYTALDPARQYISLVT